MRERWTRVENRMRPTFRTFQLYHQLGIIGKARTDVLCRRESSYSSHDCSFKVISKKPSLPRIEQDNLEDVETMDTSYIGCIGIVKTSEIE